MTNTTVAIKSESTIEEILNACINWVGDDYQTQTEEKCENLFYLWKSNHKGYIKTNKGQRYFLEGVMVYLNDTTIVIDRHTSTGIGGTITLQGFATRNPEIIIGTIIEALNF